MQIVFLKSLSLCKSRFLCLLTGQKRAALGCLNPKSLSEESVFAVATHRHRCWAPVIDSSAGSLIFCLDSGQPRCLRALKQTYEGPGVRASPGWSGEQNKGPGRWDASLCRSPRRAEPSPSSGPLGRHRFSGGSRQKHSLGLMYPAFHFYCLPSSSSLPPSLSSCVCLSSTVCNT